METIGSILGSKNFSEPPEIKQLKALIEQDYGARSSIRLSHGDLVVTVSSAALASSLRLSAPSISRRLGIKRKLRFNVG